MVRVCLLCESWESGGIESFLCNVLLHMDLSGLEVDIVAAHLGRSVFTQPLKDRGVHFYELGGRANETVKNHRAFRSLLARRQYDVLHLNVFHGLSLAYARLAREAGVPVRIAHSHNTDLRQSPTRWLKLRLHRWARERYAPDCTHRWACSAPAARFLFGGRDYRFIPNGIETERFRFDPAVRAQVRAELGAADAFVIGHVGRLCRQKNQGFLLEVFQEVLQQTPNARLLLVGEGEDLPALREKAKRLSIEDRVIFYGTTDRVERLYQAMDVFAFPSLFEGLGIVAVEAQAAGLPVVASEQVPGEAAVTGGFRTLPLSAGPGAWARALLQRTDTDRAAGVETVRQAGFEVQTVAGYIRKMWTG